MSAPHPPSKSELAALSRIVMRRQARLSLGVASIFLALILGLPLVNRFLPSVASYPIFGFPASWLFLGVVFYPITVALSILFVRRSDQIEDEFQHWGRDGDGKAS